MTTLRRLNGCLCALALGFLLLVVPEIGCGVLPDADSDGISDVADNCPSTPNFNQEDADLDGIGDVCDNCPNVANADQNDADGDGFGAACDSNDLNPLIH